MRLEGSVGRIHWILRTDNRASGLSHPDGPYSCAASQMPHSPSLSRMREVKSKTVSMEVAEKDALCHPYGVCHSPTTS
jgi:hypothetical protein